MLSLGAKERDVSGAVRAAFEREMSPLLSPLEKYCRVVARNRWEADDLLQDTLEKAFVRFRQTGGAPMNKAYVCRIASNAWIDRVRRARETVVPADWPGFERADRAEDGRGEEARRAVERVVAALTPKQRTALLLCDALACSLQEAADRLGMTVGSVKSLLHRARANARREGGVGGEEAGDSADAALVDAYALALRSGSIERVVALGRVGVGGSSAEARLAAKGVRGV
ncbi:RNA polymerase sigma factor, partial [Paenibacillus sp.]|uniref:RNA polymerase sigma factor n=1 Tax=Paenibacillus sp. TaxID=58172 RepID=UPI002D48D83E